MTLTVDLLDLILIGGRGLVMDYLCGKFGVVVLAVLVLSYGQTDRQTDRQKGKKVKVVDLYSASS